MNDKIIAVTGATGQQGGAVARKLLADRWKVRALTRDTDKPAAKELASLEGGHWYLATWTTAPNSMPLSKVHLVCGTSNLEIGWGYVK